jgi:exopolysaccharide production protein ExoQ
MALPATSVSARRRPTARDVIAGVVIGLVFVLLSRPRIPMTVTDLDKALVIAVVVLAMAVFFGWSARRTAVPWYLVAFVGLTVLSLVWSANKSDTVLGLAETTSLVIAGVLIASHVRLEVVLWAIVLASGAVLVASYLVAWANPWFGLVQTPYQQGSLMGFTLGRNHLSHAVAFGIPAALALPIRSRFSLPIRLAIAALLLIGLVPTHSATGLLTSAVTAAVGVFLLVLRALARRARMIVAAAAAVAGVIGAVLLLTNWTRFFALIGRDTDFTGRTDIWKGALAVWSERPVLGFGWDAVWGPDSYAGRQVRLESFWFPGLHPHSGYLELLLTLGVVGLVVFLAMLIITALLGLRLGLDRTLPVTLLWIPLMVVHTLVYDITETFMAGDPQGLLLEVVVVVVAWRAAREHGIGPRWVRAGLTLAPRRDAAREAGTASRV